MGRVVPTLNELAAALREPVRPLFLGRKTCLPAAPLLVGRLEAKHVLEALRLARLAPRMAARKPANTIPETRKVNACWTAHLGETEQSRPVGIYDRMDWRNQIHAGRRFRREGMLEITP